MNGIPMRFDYTKTINEQLPTFEYYRNRYISYELQIMELQQENKILRENVEHNDKVVDKVNWENNLLQQENKQLKEENRKLINNKYDAIDLIKDLACYDEDTHTYCDDINYYEVQKIIDELEEGVNNER